LLRSVVQYNVEIFNSTIVVVYGDPECIPFSSH
jgi:hypothetical protein